MTDDECREIERLTLLADCEDAYPDGVAKAHGPGTFGMHELIDRVHVFRETWHSYVETHPACLLDPHLYAAAAAISRAVSYFYQNTGAADHLGRKGP